MKVSRTWLQKYFDAPLPPVATLAEVLTFHAFEIEEIEGEMMDVKVLPDRAAYALSHRGIAKELSAILALPLKRDPLREALPTFPPTDRLVIESDPAYVIRHTGALVRNVTVGPSPAWLQEALESVDQRSINNVVDILNYVMLDVGQPSGAFDLGTIAEDNGSFRISIRRAKKGERITVLTGEEHQLTENMFAFTDAIGGTLLDIAGVKGGKSSGVTEKTTDLFLSVGTYDPTLLRRASQTLKLVTDAAQRYQNKPSPELTAYGMRDILALLTEVASGTVEGVVDFYPTKPARESVATSVARINGRLGSTFSQEEIDSVFMRLDLAPQWKDETVTVTPPFERRDITIPEDLAEEVGRIIGYDRVAPAALPLQTEAPDQARFRGMERVKDFLIERGFSEISTQSFAKKGEVKLANPLDADRPYLRPSLAENMKEALVRAKLNAPLLGIAKPKLFEIGTVFPNTGERIEIATSEAVTDLPVLEEDAAYEPVRSYPGPYIPFSVYPFVLRDVAVWTPEGTDPARVMAVIRAQGGTYLYRVDLFDTFTKDGRTSHAFHLVFQSIEKTLSDAEIAPDVDRIADALRAESGFEVR